MIYVNNDDVQYNIICTSYSDVSTTLLRFIKINTKRSVTDIYFIFLLKPEGPVYFLAKYII